MLNMPEIRLGSREHLLPDFWEQILFFKTFQKIPKKNHART
jgi:hypothetical protein